MPVSASTAKTRDRDPARNPVHDSWACNGYVCGDDAEGIATIHAALDAGVNLIDTGDFYSMGRNEMLVGKALAGRRDRALLSVKFGGLRGPDGAFLGFDGRAIAPRCPRWTANDSDTSYLTR